jgi:hypothetical protein
MSFTPGGSIDGWLGEFCGWGSKKMLEVANFG